MSARAFGFSGWLRHPPRSRVRFSLRPFPVSIVMALLAIGLSNASRADQWVMPVTPTPVVTGDSGGQFLQLFVAESIVNPASCSNADTYVLRDPVIINSATATALAAAVAGRQLRI